MRIKRSNAENIFNVFNILFMCGLMVITAYPLWHVLMASISKPEYLISHQGLLFLPQGISFAAYKAVFQNKAVYTSYMNTIIYVVAGTGLNLFLTTLGAYVIAHKGPLWVKPLTSLIVFTMFFSGGMIPTYLLVNNYLHLGNTRWALILPEAIGVYNLIVMRTFFQGLPDSLEESARIDGANEFTILWKIVIPCSKAVVAIMILFYGVGHWNSWFSAMIYLRDRMLYPLQLILREILIANDSTTAMASSSNIGDTEQIGQTIRFATVVVATVPILCVYPFVQKHFTKGVMIGSVKG